MRASSRRSRPQAQSIAAGRIPIQLVNRLFLEAGVNEEELLSVSCCLRAGLMRGYYGEAIVGSRGAGSGWTSTT